MHNKRHSIKSAFWHIFYSLFSKTEIVRIQGTTDNSGNIMINTNASKEGSNAYCISNASKTLNTPYSVTIDYAYNKAIRFRIRNITTNEAVANTEVNFPVLVIYK